MTNNLLDLDYYRQVNPDLANFTDEQATQHFFDFGLREGRDFSPIVDLDLYRAANPDLAAVGFTENRQFFDHLSTFGVAEGRLFSHTFNADFYRSSYSDLVTVGLNNEQLFDHFQTFGINEGRVASNMFDIGFYLDRHPDLIAAGFTNRQALTHFNQFGIDEGRIASTQFDVGTYLSLHPDLIQAGLTSSQAFNHYQVFGIHERRIAAPLLPVTNDPGSQFEIDTSFDFGAISGHRRFSNVLNANNQNDLYQFTLFRPSQIGIDLFKMQQTSLGGFRGVQSELLVDLDGNGQLDFDERLDVGGGLFGNFPITGLLSPGTYWLRSTILLSEDALFRPTPYDGSLLVSPIDAIPVDGAGNSASAARDLGALSTVQTFNDAIGLLDNTDVYRFTLDEPTNIEAILDGNSGNITIEIARDFNNNGEIESARFFRDYTEIIETASAQSDLGIALDAGTYFLQLRRDRTDTDYTLTLSPQASRLPPDTAGNIFEMALDLGGLDTGRSVSETVNEADRTDFYQFEIDTPTNVGIVLDRLTGNSALAISRDRNGDGELEFVQGVHPTLGSSAPEQTAWSLYLTPDTYFVRVSANPFNFSLSQYNLSITPTPPPGLPPDTVGNTPDAARNLDVLTGMVGVTDSFGEADRLDYYRFVLDRPSTVDLLLEVAESIPGQNIGVSIFADADNNGARDIGGFSRTIPFDDRTLTAEASILLDPGVYFTSVINGDKNVNYDLSLSAT
ncbi:hypothetical protein IQ235_06180 [Oscillatoriales cyanobacterium LEGE 11467]|uniref:Peptidase C-terminal archaeal/bacterial domain-containing protein n=1 Tax=Zarconia navalis LEGE 11467 TaxID=1828826 RepID=A0A928VVN8_9CYAN|nr:hypothetical protein [Zarconia navalis]MBE9040379.1 hypothetical protein [Zarconia navalis LEGE 11467]